MYFRIIKNDISKSKLITMTTTCFIIVASLLVSLVAILIINLTGSISTLMSKAETPHFMQMHSGDIDMERLNSFALENEEVEKFQVLEFVNVEGTSIYINEQSLASSNLDNGVVKQSDQFDYLLDLDNNIITVKNGEIYLPISYFKNGSASIGDRVSIVGKEFTVAGFARDSQMNSSLSSSQRLLISDDDFMDLKELGDMEYLIEFRLVDGASVSAFENLYITSGLESNGPTITYVLFQAINAISDGIMIVIVLLVSILVVVITFLCIRFTLIAKIEEDYKEIGVMKAIGLRVKDIKKIYLAKYTLIAFLGCLLGFILSLFLKEKLLENIRLYMGKNENLLLASIFGIVGILLVFLSIIAYVSRVLKRFKKISPAQAIRFGNTEEKYGKLSFFKLSKNKLFSTNIYLGLKDVLTRKKLYITMLIVLIITTFIIVVPQNLYHTISDQGFIKYLGIGNSDINMNIQQTDHITTKVNEIANQLDNDDNISQYALLTTISYQTVLNDGTTERIRVDLGDHTIFPVMYTDGKMPTNDNEIALSVLNADNLEKKVGDTLILIINGEEVAFEVSGLYSDVTNGGKTAKASFSDSSNQAMWYNIYADVNDTTMLEDIINDYSTMFSFAKVLDINEMANQVFGSTFQSVNLVSKISIIVAIVITMLIILLFMKMLVSKDRYPIAILKSIGFKSFEITKQYMVRSLFVLLIGVLLGILLSNTIGEILVGIGVSTLGAANFSFIINPLNIYLICPLIVISTTVIATILGTLDINKVKISENIKE